MQLRNLLGHLKSLVDQAPDAPIVEVFPRTTSRREFYSYVLEISRFLEKSRPRKVSIFAEQHELTYAAIFACLSTGTNYNPIASETPAEKLQMYLEDFEPALVLCDEVGAEALADLGRHWPILQLREARNWIDSTAVQANPSIPSWPTIAYTMFTSGSTGRPKGVLVRSTGVENFLGWLLKSIPSGDEQRVSQFASIGFDLSFAEIMFGILSGGCLIPLPNSKSRAYTMRLIADRKITHLFAVPSLIQLMIREHNSTQNYSRALPDLKFCLALGEPLLVSHARFLLQTAPGIFLVNTYGPTEATVLCSEFRLDSGALIERLADGDVLPIGSPIDGNVFEIRDPDYRGVGELVILGKQVALGYLDEGQTTKSFLSNHSEPPRGYKTGDLVNVDSRGLYHFRGRLDRQVKVHGTRVELGEIEAAVRSNLPGESAVILANGKLVCLSDNLNLEDKAFRNEVARNVRLRMGAAFSPVSYKVVNEMPKSSSGKLDYRALQEMVAEMYEP